jgi:hypothetical protein
LWFCFNQAGKNVKKMKKRGFGTASIKKVNADALGGGLIFS